MKNLSIDVETFSSVDLNKCGVYRYCSSPDFEILLFGYSIDHGPVKTVDLASGEMIPEEILQVLTDSSVIKWAFNCNFERVCLSTYLRRNYHAIQSSVEQHGGGIKGIIGTAVDAYKSIWEIGFSKINELTGGKLGDALSSAQGKLDAIKGAFSSMIENAKSIVSGGLDRIKGFFAGCHLELPHIKLPHFSISGKLSIDPPSVPHLSVDWYRKAMDDAYILNSPTIFGAAGGRLLGGGEAGQEAVVGTDKLAEIVQGALAGVSGGDIIIPVYIGQERIDEIVVRATQRSNYRSGGR